MHRPSTAAGRIRYTDRNAQNHSVNERRSNNFKLDTSEPFSKFIANCMCHDKIRRYKKTLMTRDKQLTKAMNMVRKHQLSELFVQEYVKSCDNPVPNNEIIELLECEEADDDKLHLGVLYASPLGYEVPDGLGSKTFKIIQELNFKNDIAQITNAISGGKNKVNYSIRMGTPINFISTVSRNPHVLHFICHGIKNENYGKKED